MPIIPVQKQLTSVDVPVVDVNVGAAGMVQRAVGQLGGQLADTSMKLIGQMKQAEAVDAAQQAHASDRLEAEKYMAESKLANPDGYVKNGEGGMQTNLDGSPVTISQDFQEWSERRYRKNQDSMPSNLAQEMYRERANPFFTSQILSSFNEEHAQKINAFKSNADLRDRSRADSLVTLAHPNKVYEISNESRLDRMQQTGPGKIFDLNQTRADVMKNDQAFAEAAGKHALTQALATPGPKERSGERVKYIDQWITWINESPEQGPLTKEAMARKSAGLPILSEMFSPDTKASILHSLQQAKEQAKVRDKSALDLLLRENTAYIANNGKPSKAITDKLKGDIMQQVATGLRIPEQGAHDMATMTMAEQLQKMPQSIKLLNPAAQLQYFQSLEKPAYEAAQSFLERDPRTGQVGSIAQQEVRATSQKAYAAWEKERTEDWAAYLENSPDTTSQEKKAAFQLNNVTMTDPRTLKGMGGVLNAQIESSRQRYSEFFPGKPEHFRILTKTDSEQMASFFNDPAKIRTIEEQAAAIRTMAKEYGSNFPKVMQQMVEDGHLKAPMMFAANMAQSQIQTQNLLSGLLFKDADSEETRIYLASKKITDSHLDGELGKKFAPFINAASQRAPGDPFSTMGRDAIVKAARNVAIMNLKDGRADDATDAAQQAYESMVQGAYHVKESSAPGILGGFFQKKYNLLVPKQIGSREISDGEAQTIAEYSRNILTPDWLRVLGVVPFAKRDGTPSDLPEQFYNQVSSSNGRAVINPKTEAVEIWMHDKYNHVDRAVLRADGQKVSIPLEKALQYRPGDTPMSTQDTYKESISPEPPRKYIPGLEPKNAQNSSSAKDPGFSMFNEANASQGLGAERDPNVGDSPLNKNISFKEPHFRQQLQNAAPRIRSVVNDIAGELHILGDKAIISRVTDKVKGETGVHQTGRAVDISTRQLDLKTIKAIVTTMNLRYPRYDGFETVMYHKAKGGVYHLHIQVPTDKTRLAKQ